MYIQRFTDQNYEFHINWTLLCIGMVHLTRFHLSSFTYCGDWLGPYTHMLLAQKWIKSSGQQKCIILTTDFKFIGQFEPLTNIFEKIQFLLIFHENFKKKTNRFNSFYAKLPRTFFKNLIHDLGRFFGLITPPE